MYDPMTDRLPPHSRDAERGVLGGILRDPDTLAIVQQSVRAESFYFDAHRKVYEALCGLRAEGQPADLVLLHERLTQAKQLEDVGGPAFLAELWESVPTGANAEYHAKIVRDHALVRDLIHTANEILRDAYDRAGPADELVAAAERKVLAVAGGRTTGRPGSGPRRSS